MNRAVLSVALCLCVAAAASADPTLYDSEAAYDAATASELFRVDFNSSLGVVNGNSFSAFVTFGSPEASNPALVLNSSNALTDAGSTVASNGVGPIDGVFTNPVSAFGFDYLSGNVSSVDLFDTGGGLIASVAVSAPWPAFFGVTSSAPIKSFQINNAVFQTGGNDRFFIDNFRANAPVPEPSTIVLVALAALGFGVWRHRRA